MCYFQLLILTCCTETTGSYQAACKIEGLRWMGSPASEVPLTQPLSPDSQIGGRTLKAQPGSADTNDTSLNHPSGCELSSTLEADPPTAFLGQGKGCLGIACQSRAAAQETPIFSILGFYSTKGYGNHWLLKSWSHLITAQLSLCLDHLGHCCGPAEKRLLWCQSHCTLWFLHKFLMIWKYQACDKWKLPKMEKKKKSKIKLSPTQALTDFSNLISSSAVSV